MPILVYFDYIKISLVKAVIFFFSVDDGAILDIILENFNFPTPSGFEKIMLEQSLL